MSKRCRKKAHKQDYFMQVNTYIHIKTRQICMKKAHSKPSYRSKFEESFHKSLPLGSAQYESAQLKYIIPQSKHVYTPDFHVTGTNIYLETKGIFAIQDRKKHLLIKEQHKDKRVILVFMDHRKKISKGSKTSYGMWCDKNGVEWMTPFDAAELVKLQIL